MQREASEEFKGQERTRDLCFKMITLTRHSPDQSDHVSQFVRDNAVLCLFPQHIINSTQMSQIKRKIVWLLLQNHSHNYYDSLT